MLVKRSRSRRGSKSMSLERILRKSGYKKSTRRSKRRSSKSRRSRSRK